MFLLRLRREASSPPVRAEGRTRRDSFGESTKKSCTVIVLRFLCFLHPPPRHPPRRCAPSFYKALFFFSVNPPPNKAPSAPLCLCRFLSSTCLSRWKRGAVSLRAPSLLAPPSKSAVPVKSAEAQSAFGTAAFAPSKFGCTRELS